MRARARAHTHTHTQVHRAWQSEIARQLLARLGSKVWETREAAVLALTHLVSAAASPMQSGRPASYSAAEPHRVRLESMHGAGGREDGASTRGEKEGHASPADGAKEGSADVAAAGGAITVLQAFDFGRELEMRGGVMLLASEHHVQDASGEDNRAAGGPSADVGGVNKRGRWDANHVTVSQTRDGVEESIGGRGTGGGSVLRVEFTGRAPRPLVAQAEGALEEEEDRSGWWPFDLLCEHLYADLLHAEWERRHGAARGLRVLMPHHPLLPCPIGTVRAQCVARRRLSEGTEDERQGGSGDANAGRVRRGETKEFVEECAAQLLRVLAFDRLRALRCFLWPSRACSRRARARSLSLSHAHAISLARSHTLSLTRSLALLFARGSLHSGSAHRFSDYSGDLVVSPVREAAAQALGITVRRLEGQQEGGRRRGTVVLEVLRVLQDLLSWEEDWEVRQSAFKGLQFCLAVVPAPYPAHLAATASHMILRGFRDMDDVRASAAEAALLMSKRGHVAWSHGHVPQEGEHAGASGSQLTGLLWECLEECDEESAATAPLLSLLSFHLSLAADPREHTAASRTIPLQDSATLNAKNQEPEEKGHEDMEHLFGDGLCRLKSLFKFFRHNLASVRKATLSILTQVLATHRALLHDACSAALAPDNGGAELKEARTAHAAFAVQVLEVVFLNALIEPRTDVVADTEALWNLVLELTPPSLLATLTVSEGRSVRGQEAGGARLSKWIRAAATPVGQLLSPKDVCSYTEYLESITHFDSYHTAAPDPRKKGRGRKAGMASVQEQSGGGNKYDVGSATREVACRMISALLCRCASSTLERGASEGGEGSAGAGGIVLESMLSSSNEWVRFVGSWVALEAQGREEPPLRGGSSRGRGGVGQGGGSGLWGKGSDVLSARAVRLLSALAQKPEAEDGDPIQRDTAGFAAGCLLSAPLQQQSNALVTVLLRCLAQQADSIVQRRSCSALVQAARHRRVSTPAALLLYSQVCCEPSITPLSFSSLASSSATLGAATAMADATMAEDPGGSREHQPGGPRAEEGAEEEVVVEMVLRDVPTHTSSNIDVPSHEEGDRLAIRARRIRQRGAQWVLTIGASVLGDDVFDCLPCLWEQSGGVLEAARKVGGGQGVWENRPEEMIKALQLAEVVLASASCAGRRLVGVLLCQLPHLLPSGRAALRHMSARSLAQAAAFDTNPTMEVLVREVLPMLQETASGSARLGAIEAVFRTIHVLGARLLPFAVLLVTPVLACMSDAHAVVREAATRSFASLLQALPLEKGVPDPEGISADLVAGRIHQRRFLEQLWDPSQIEPYAITANITAALRPYQHEGVNWLGFLIRFQLHGILCDDMGLGKTLQTIAALASDVVNRRTALRESKGTAAQDKVRALPSLIVCPTTLVQHWCHEVAKFCPDLTARPYAGTPQERQALIQRVKASDDVLIISYEALRNDVHRFVREALVWNFAVLDEGHVIKNPKSKIALAVKQVGLRARHRLILTGTPIQNNVLELWGLFDFLMPSFLGTEAVFNNVYSKPILASGRDVRVNRKRFSTSSDAAQADDPATGAMSHAAHATMLGGGGGDEGREDGTRRNQEAQLIEAGELALDGLHRQVLPFMLRRTKQEVLEDLPPKIIQDILCPMTPLQQALYTAYEQQTGVCAEGFPASEEAPSSKALSALTYLKKLANHPVLVLGQGDEDIGVVSGDGGKGEEKALAGRLPQHANARDLWKQYHADCDAHDIQVAPKLQALLQLLLECGIGGGAGSSENELKREGGASDGLGRGGEEEPTSAFLGAGHRVLIFSQMRGMLDLVEQDVLGKHLPAVSFLRMDGSTPTHKRFQMQLDFNADPSIEVMLLTTHVGGLGLTLTGADTIVFLDHDWNPMRDLQAMDRAHRIGQTRTVNVYRLIAQGTLEERIMGLQRFKLNIANTVVSQDNAHLQSMGTSTVLDLMGQQPAAKGEKKTKGSSISMPPGQQGGLAGQARKALGVAAEEDELWGEEQYAGLDVDAFLAQEKDAVD